jgi:hypothetical protein
VFAVPVAVLRVGRRTAPREVWYARVLVEPAGESNLLVTRHAAPVPKQLVPVSSA